MIDLKNFFAGIKTTLIFSFRVLIVLAGFSILGVVFYAVFQYMPAMGVLLVSTLLIYIAIKMIHVGFFYKFNGDENGSS